MPLHRNEVAYSSTISDRIRQTQLIDETSHLTRDCWTMRAYSMLVAIAVTLASAETIRYDISLRRGAGQAYNGVRLESPGILSARVELNGTWGPTWPICGDGFTESDALEYCRSRNYAGLAQFALVPSANASDAEVTTSCTAARCQYAYSPGTCTSGTIIGLECTSVELGIAREADPSKEPLNRPAPTRVLPPRARGIGAMWSFNGDVWRYLWQN